MGALPWETCLVQWISRVMLVLWHRVEDILVEAPMYDASVISHAQRGTVVLNPPTEERGNGCWKRVAPPGRP